MAVVAYIVTVSASGTTLKRVGDPVASVATAKGLAGGTHDSTPELTTIGNLITGHVVLLIDTASVTTRNQLTAAIDELRRAVDGQKLLP